jgi:hypothetical protein
MKRENLLQRIVSYALVAACSLIAVSVMAEPSVVSPKSTHEQATTSKTISGTITDQKSNEVLAGATIVYDGKKTYSDLDGNFSIPSNEAKSGKLVISLISYQNATVEIAASSEKVAVALKQQ